MLCRTLRRAVAQRKRAQTVARLSALYDRGARLCLGALLLSALLAAAWCAPINQKSRFLSPATHSAYHTLPSPPPFLPNTSTAQHRRLCSARYGG